MKLILILSYSIVDIIQIKNFEKTKRKMREWYGYI